MKIPEKISALQAKRKLLRQMDASLLAHTAVLCSSPSVEQVPAARTCRDALVLHPARNQTRSWAGLPHG